MLSKNEIKYIQSLCHKKQRQQDGLFVVEGPKLLEEVLNSNYTVKKIFALQEWAAQNITAVHVTIINEDELKKISTQQHPNQVLAIVEQLKENAKPLFKNSFSLMLDGIQDPGNLGTIIRIADWFGIKQMVCSEDTVELYNPKVIQSTMGSFTRVKLWYTDLKSVLMNIDVPVLGALLQGENIYDAGTFKEGVLLIGNEGKGIREEILPFVTHPVTIPKIGGAESLNAAIAAGILVSHLIKK
jgi:TrmH family RNA methyltransferase